MVPTQNGLKYYDIYILPTKEGAKYAFYIVGIPTGLKYAIYPMPTLKGSLWCFPKMGHMCRHILG